MSELRPLLIPLSEVLRITGRSRSAVYTDIKHGRFPRPCKVDSSSRWLYREIEEWVAERVAERDGTDERTTDELVERAARTGESLDTLVAERRRAG